MSSVLPLLCPHCTDGVLLLEKYYSDHRIECDQCEATFSELGLRWPGWIGLPTYRQQFHENEEIQQYVAKGWRFFIQEVHQLGNAPNWFAVEVFRNDKPTPAMDRERRDREYRYSRGPGGPSYNLATARTIDELIAEVVFTLKNGHRPSYWEKQKLFHAE